MPSSKTSSARYGLEVVELLAKGSHRLPTSIQAVAEDNIYFCHQSWRNQAGAQLGASPLLTSDHGAGRCSAHYRRKKVIINIAQLQTLRPTTATCLQDIYWYSSGRNVTGSTNHFLTRFKAHSMKWNLQLTQHH